MGCPCNDPKPEAWPIYVETDRPKPVDWHIVVLSAGKAKPFLDLMEPFRPLIKSGRAAVTLVDTACGTGPARWVYPCDVRDLCGAGYVGIPAETCVPRAYNAGVSRVRNSNFTLLLHDDVTIPEGDEWLCSMEACLKISAGIVVPHIEGACNNPVQAAPRCGTILHTVEYICSAALAMRTGEIVARGLNERMSGYDWWQIELQARMANEGRAVLVADCTVQHAGRGTYQDIDTNDAFRFNLDMMNRTMGWARDFQARPRYPRVHIRRNDAKIGTALCVVYDSCWDDKHDIVAAIKVRYDEGRFNQICIVDTAPSDKVRERFIEKFGLGYVLYSPEYMGDPVSQTISMSDYQRVETLDCRPGAGHPIQQPSIYRGRRIRCGSHYNLPTRLTDYHIGMLTHFAVGDTVMMTPAIKAFKAAFPWIKLHVHHGWDAAELLLHNPDIDELLQYRMDQQKPPTEVVDVGIGNGGDRMILAPFSELGLPEPEEVQLQYFMTGEEKAQALGYLANLGVDTSSHKLVIGVQRHGGWSYKRWAHTDELLAKLVDSGATVIEFGSDDAKMGAAIPGVYRVLRPPLRILSAVIYLLDAMVSYESGLGFIASAVGTPVVAIWGNTDPSKLLGMCGPNIVVLNRRSPEMCENERGASCRTVGNMSICPFREAGFGADCIDDTTADDVLSELPALPKWGVPLASR